MVVLLVLVAQVKTVALVVVVVAVVVVVVVIVAVVVVVVVVVVCLSACLWFYLLEKIPSNGTGMEWAVGGGKLRKMGHGRIL